MKIIRNQETREKRMEMTTRIRQEMKRRKGMKIKTKDKGKEKEEQWKELAKNVLEKSK